MRHRAPWLTLLGLVVVGAIVPLARANDVFDAGSGHSDIPTPLYDSRGPTVMIVAPEHVGSVESDTTIAIGVFAVDRSGVTLIRFRAEGAVGGEHSAVFSPPQQKATAIFRLTIAADMADGSRIQLFATA